MTKKVKGREDNVRGDGVHNNSIRAQFDRGQLSPELRAKYVRNLKKMREDADSMEEWYAHDFGNPEAYE